MRLFRQDVLARLLAAVPVLLTACAVEGKGDDTGSEEEECVGDKCDDPGAAADRECEEKCKSSSDADCVTECRDAAALDHCEARRADALESAQKAYTPDNIRWACSDVEGVNTNMRDDRGQEY